MAIPAKLPTPPLLATLEADQPLALFLDFDGTLIPIANGPDEIVVPPQMSQRLAALAQRLDNRLALISGRSLDNLSHYLGELNIFRAGSHGAACVTPDGSVLGDVPEPIPEQVSEALAAFAEQESLLFERKSHGAALHYRARPDLEKSAQDFAEKLAWTFDLAIKRGKCVFELVQPGLGKAGAVAKFMAHPVFAKALPIFIGDDITDEDGFAAANALGGFGIAVGERMSNGATYHLENVQEVYQWLKL